MNNAIWWVTIFSVKWDLLYLLSTHDILFPKHISHLYKCENNKTKKENLMTAFRGWKILFNFPKSKPLWFSQERLWMERKKKGRTYFKKFYQNYSQALHKTFLSFYVNLNILWSQHCHTIFFINILVHWYFALSLLYFLDPRNHFLLCYNITFFQKGKMWRDFVLIWAKWRKTDVRDIPTFVLD